MQSPNFEDKSIPKLQSYVAAILNVKEKHLSFLPCYSGYLIFSEKKPIILWVHKNTVEGILKAGFNLITEEILFKLIWGGTVLKELLKGVIPDVPKRTVMFYPGLHRIKYGIIRPETGPSGIIVKGISKATDIVSKTGKEIVNLISPSTQNDPYSKTENVDKESMVPKSFVNIQFQDFLYTTLSKEKLFKSNLPISSGFEFRTVFEQEAMLFMRNIQKKSLFTVEKTKEKGLI